MNTYKSDQIIQRVIEQLQLAPIFSDPSNVHYGKPWTSTCNLDSFILAIEPFCYDIISADSTKILSWLKESQVIQITDETIPLVYFNENHPLLSNSCLLSSYNNSIEQIIVRRVFTWITCSNSIDLSMAYTIPDILSHIENIATVKVPVYSLAIVKRLEDSHFISVDNTIVRYCTLSSFSKRKDTCSDMKMSTDCKKQIVNSM